MPITLAHTHQTMAPNVNGALQIQPSFLPDAHGSAKKVDGGDDRLNGDTCATTTDFRTHQNGQSRRETNGDEGNDSEELSTDPRRHSSLLWRRRGTQILQARLAAAGLDENGDPVDLQAQLKYPMNSARFLLPGSRFPVYFNPVVVTTSVITLWSLVIWCAVDPKHAIDWIKACRQHISLEYTWLFQGSKALYFFFMLYIVYKYGHIRLGKAGESPAFSTMSMLCMIFAAGTGPGLLVYCVQEPLSHQFGNAYAQAGYRSQDELHMFAINLTVTNWGVTCWTQYTLVAICLSLAGYRFNLPMTFRSCFYPILGAYTWGWMGDLIDAMSIVVTIAGVCTTLALPVIQIVEGLIYIGWVDANSQEGNITSIQVATVWFFTFISTISVISGLRGGVRFMCWLAVILGFLLLLLVFLLDDSKYLLNLIVQEVGYYLQNSLFQINLWTDAFGQLREGSGRAIDGKSADQNWANDWIVFYQAWAVTWSAVVGLFVAYLSRGRRIWEIWLYCFAAPLGYCLVWFCVWGGIALRQSRQASEMEALGLEHFNSSTHFLSDASTFCFEVPQMDVVVNGELVFANHLPGVTPVCQFDRANGISAVFNVLYSFSFPESFDNGGLGKSLSLLFLLCCPVFYLASADAASLMVDIIASNGRKRNHWARRMFWAVTIGALTTVILSSSGADALYAIQAAAIISALPLVILFCFMLQSILLLCKAADAMGDGDHEDTDYQFSDQPRFSLPVYGGIFNVIEYLSTFGCVNDTRVELEMHRPTRAQVIEFFKGLVVPFVSLSQVLRTSYPQNPMTNLCFVGTYAFCYSSWLALLFKSLESPGLKGLVWASFFFSGAMLAFVRSGFRAKHNILSSVLADIVASCLLWPQVLTQMRLHPTEPSKALDRASEDRTNGDTSRSG